MFNSTKCVNAQVQTKGNRMAAQKYVITSERLSTIGALHYVIHRAEVNWQILLRHLSARGVLSAWVSNYTHTVWLAHGWRGEWPMLPIRLHYLKKTQGISRKLKSFESPIAGKYAVENKPVTHCKVWTLEECETLQSAAHKISLLLLLLCVWPKFWRLRRHQVRQE